MRRLSWPKKKMKPAMPAVIKSLMAQATKGLQLPKKLPTSVGIPAKSSLHGGIVELFVMIFGGPAWCVCMFVCMLSLRIERKVGVGGKS